MWLGFCTTTVMVVITKTKTRNALPLTWSGSASGAPLLRFTPVRLRKRRTGLNENADRALHEAAGAGEGLFVGLESFDVVEHLGVVGEHLRLLAVVLDVLASGFCSAYSVKDS